MQSCYMCQAAATSREHVPPKCFFPEKRDLPSYLDYRHNLITVPSCDLHNLSKSDDDQYLLMVIVSHWQNNPAAQRHFSNKVLRAVARRPSLARAFARQWLPARVGSTPTGALVIDTERFVRSMACIVRGLHFHNYREQCTDDVLIESPALPPVIRLNLRDGAQIRACRQALGSKADTVRSLRALCTAHLESVPWLGENPDIFRWQIWRHKEERLLLVRMVFYGGFVVMGCCPGSRKSDA